MHAQGQSKNQFVRMAKAEPIELDVQVTYRTYNGAYEKSEFVNVKRWDMVAPLDLTSPHKPTFSPHLIYGHSYFFLDLLLNPLQCSEGYWTFQVVKKPCSADNEHCTRTPPHLFISHKGQCYRTRDNVAESGPLPQERPLIIPGRVYELTFSIDDFWDECSCNVVWLSITYNTCHNTKYKTLLPLLLLRQSDWEKVHATR